MFKSMMGRADDIEQLTLKTYHVDLVELAILRHKARNRSILGVRLEGDSHTIEVCPLRWYNRDDHVGSISSHGWENTTCC